MNSNLTNKTPLTKSGRVLIISIKKNWDSVHARLNSHYDAWSYEKKKHEKVLKRLKLTGNMFRKNLQLKDVC